MTASSGRVSIHAIAMLAGVGTATVDRVMNGREGVAAGTRKRVLEAARQLGSRRMPASPDNYQLRVLVVRTGIDDDYFLRIESALDQVARELRPAIELRRLVRVPTAQLRAAVREEVSRCHGVIVLAHDGGEVRLAMKPALKKGIPVLSLTSDLGLGNQTAHVGIDNVAAGRTAAWLISRLAPSSGRTLLMTGSQSYQVHRERTLGFRQGLASWAPHMKLIGPCDVEDLDEISERDLRLNFERHGRLHAIYNSGGANEGIRLVLEEMREADRPVWITHETSLGNLDLLRRGVITTLIDQSPEQQARVGLELILHHYGELTSAPSAKIDLRIVTYRNKPLRGLVLQPVRKFALMLSRSWTPSDSPVGKPEMRSAAGRLPYRRHQCRPANVIDVKAPSWIGFRDEQKLNDLAAAARAVETYGPLFAMIYHQDCTSATETLWKLIALHCGHPQIAPYKCRRTPASID